MILDLVFGFLLVFAGRNFFWLCVGIVGFLTGMQCATALGFSTAWMELLTAVMLGCLGALLAICFEWFAVVFGVGFLGGGYVLINMFPSMAGQEQYAWPIFVVGGIVGLCLMVIIFDWTLILVSSLLGAMLIANAFHGPEGFRAFLFIGSALTGVLVQYLTFKDAANQEDSRRGK